MGLGDIGARSFGGRAAAGPDLVAGNPTLSSLMRGRQADNERSAHADSTNVRMSAQETGSDAAAYPAIHD